MEQEENILFDRYWRNEMNSQEKQAFEQRLQADVVFKQNYILFLAMVGGVQLAGKAALVADIQQIQNEVKPDSYQPPKSGGGFNFFQAFNLLVIGGLITTALLYMDVIPSKHEKIEDAKQWLHQWDEHLEQFRTTDTIYDTIYHYVPYDGE